MLAELVDAVVGVDTHRDTHEVEIALPTGTPIATCQVSNDSTGFAQLLAWILMPQYDELDVLGGGCAAHQQDQSEHLPEDKYSSRSDMAAIMPNRWRTRSPLVSSMCDVLAPRRVRGAGARALRLDGAHRGHPDLGAAQRLPTHRTPSGRTPRSGQAALNVTPVRVGDPQEGWPLVRLPRQKAMRRSTMAVVGSGTTG
jgi:hypothetical protein